MKRILDNIGTACWFLMDACWMNNYNVLATIFMFLAIVLFLLQPFVFKIHDMELVGWLATTCWLLMNSCWMLNDVLLLNKTITEKFDTLIYFRNMFAVAGLLSIVFIIIFDTHRIIKIRRFK